MSDSFAKEETQLVSLYLKHPELELREVNSEAFSQTNQLLLDAIQHARDNGVQLTRKSFLAWVDKYVSKKQEIARLEVAFNKIVFSKADRNDFPMLRDKVKDAFLTTSTTESVRQFNKDKDDKGVEFAVNRHAERMSKLQKTQSAKRLPVITSKSLIENSAIVESAPVIYGILRRGEICNVIASSKARKSWLVHDLAISLETGTPWLGFSCEASKVLLIDNELHAGTLKARLSKVYEAKDTSPTGSLGIIAARGKGCTLKDIPDLLEGQKFDVIILDALYRFYEEGFDENANADMTALYNYLDGIAEKNNTAIIIVHHASKGSQQNKSITDIGSGAGAMSRATDTQITIRPQKNKDIAKEDVAYLDFVNRSFPPVDRIAVLWKYPSWVRTDDTTMPYEAVQDEMDEFDFAKRYFTNDWVAKSIILDNAMKDGMSSATFIRRLRLSTDKKLVEYRTDQQDKRLKEFRLKPVTEDLVF